MAFRVDVLTSLAWHTGPWMIWQSLAFELGSLLLPCFMFQPLGTKQHFPENADRGVSGLCASAKSIRFSLPLSSVTGVLTHPFPPGVMSY